MKLYLLLLIALMSVAGCSTSTAPAPDTTDGGDTSVKPDDSAATTKAAVNATPADAVKAFATAVKAKDEAGLRGALSEKTLKFMDLQAKMTKKSIMDSFDAEEFKDVGETLETRNEKIDGDKATLEVKAPKDDKWDPMPFVKENGSWKIALADEDFDKDFKEMEKMAKEMEKKADDSGKTEKDADSGDASKEKKDEK